MLEHCATALPRVSNIGRPNSKHHWGSSIRCSTLLLRLSLAGSHSMSVSTRVSATTANGHFSVRVMDGARAFPKNSACGSLPVTGGSQRVKNDLPSEAVQAVARLNLF